MDNALLESMLKDSYNDLWINGPYSLTIRKSGSTTDGVVVLQNLHFRVMLVLPTLSSDLSCLKDLDLIKTSNEITEKINKSLVTGCFTKEQVYEELLDEQFSMSVVKTDDDIKDIDLAISHLAPQLKQFICSQFDIWLKYTQDNLQEYEPASKINGLEVGEIQEAVTQMFKEFKGLKASKRCASKIPHIDSLAEAFLRSSRRITNDAKLKENYTKVAGGQEIRLRFITRFENSIFKMKNDDLHIKAALNYALSEVFQKRDVKESIKDIITKELMDCSSYFINTPVELSQKVLEIIFTDLHVYGVLEYEMERLNLDTISQELARSFINFADAEYKNFKLE